MIKVLIESPFAGVTQLARDLNLLYARQAMKDCFDRGEAPFASHLLYTQPEVLDDTIPHERQLGIDVGLLWGSLADKTVVYTDRGISNGMEYGIENAKKSGRPIEYRTLPEWGIFI